MQVRSILYYDLLTGNRKTQVQSLAGLFIHVGCCNLVVDFLCDHIIMVTVLISVDA